MLKALAHTNQAHKLVLVMVHASQRSNVRKDVLQGVGQLECVNTTKTELDVCIDDEFGKPEKFTTQMESISETRLLTLLRGESLYRLQVQVVVEMHVVQVLLYLEVRK